MNNKSRYIGILLLLFMLKFTGSEAQFYNGSFQEFGKNRVQEVTFFWQYYDFQRFRVFFYGNGKEHAEYVAKSVHQNLKGLERFFETELDGKLDILVFNKQSDFKQSNIGLTNEITSNVGGKNKIIGNKMFLYFETTHPQFDVQIKAAITELITNKMIYQSSWKKVVRGSAAVDLPDWFSKGLYSYKSEEWSAEIDNKVKDNVLEGNYDRMGRLPLEKNRIAGHAFWNYIGEVYGKELIPQIIYLVSVSRSFESSLRFVLGKSMKTLNADMVRYYKKKYELGEKTKTLPLQEEVVIKKRKKKGEITQMALSPDGKKIAYSTNDLGKYFLWIYDIDKDKYTKVLRKGYRVEREADHSFPIIDWHPNSEVLAYVIEKEGSVFFNFYNSENKNRNSIQVPKIDKITSFSYNHKGSQLVFSGMQDGSIDLFLYTILGNGYMKLTNDFFDEIHPVFIDSSTKILFSSNRETDSMFIKSEIKPIAQSFDLFIYDLKKKFQPRLRRVTNTPLANEFHPFELKDKEYTYISDEDGERNRYLAVFDSVISSVDTTITYRYYSKLASLTDYKRNISKLDYAAENKELAMLLYYNNEYRIYKGSGMLDKMRANESGENYEKINPEELLEKGRRSTIEILRIKELNNPSTVIKTDSYLFLEEEAKEEEKNKKETKVKEEVQPEVKAPTTKKNNVDGMVFMNPKNAISNKTASKIIDFKLPNRKIYNVNFTIDEVTSQLDNNFINNSYQVFNPNQPSFNNPNINIFNMVQIKDLMEDYRLIGGVNLSFNLRDNDYMLAFEDLSQRFDKKYLFTRQVYSNEDGIYPVRTQIHEFKYRIKYPFSEVASLGVTFNVRNDRILTSSVDRVSLETPNSMRNMAGVKMEYVFDNTFERGINLYEGTRLKLFGEFYNELLKEQTDFFVLGADIRNYQKIHREMIFATRLAASTSFGSRKLVYYMGGVDGDFSPDFNNNTIIPTDQGFAFQTIATPMRGFIQNTRFGNSFAVINSEVRWPIFRYFSDAPIQSKFLSSFQVVGFGDVGTAWTGPSPYSIENSFNKTEISQKPITVIIENQREPIIFGYGIGVRAELFGYFVRYDWSWGIEDGVNQGRINYFSLSLDF